MTVIGSLPYDNGIAIRHRLFHYISIVNYNIDLLLFIIIIIIIYYVVIDLFDHPCNYVITIEVS